MFTKNDATQSNKRKEPRRSIIDVIRSLKNVFLMVGIGALLAFLLFWFLYWLTNPSEVIVDNHSKHVWEKHPIKFKMGNIRVGLKIIPSANTENNIIIMDYMKNTVSESKKGNVDKSYHSFSDTESYFPSLTLKKEYVPFGDPDPYCFYISWSQVDKYKATDRYKPFSGMERCNLVNKGHMLWNKNDPKIGVDIRMWRQEVFQIKNGGEEGEYNCESIYRGIYTLNKGYSYSVVENICFKVKETSESKTESDQKWEIVEGGYKNGAYAKFVKAIPGFEYNFDHVPIEVRAYVDPFAGKTEEEDKEAEDPTRTKSGFSFLKFFMWVALVIFIITFTIWLILTIIDGIKGSYDTEEARRLVKLRANQ